MNNKYEGWLVSNNLAKRSIAVWGHLIVAYLLFMLIGMAIALVIALLSMIFG